MNDSLHITLVQTDLHWNNPSSNITRLTQLLKGIQHTDVIVLPEMFTTAFCMHGKAEEMSGDSIHWMKQTAKEYEVAICGSLIIQEEGKQYNRFVWMSPEGEHVCYDKRHLFSLMGEAEKFTPGSERKIIHYKGWKICPQICYDLRFPIFSRNDLGYDLLLYVANWPERRIVSWDKLLQARAIENQSYVVGVNRVGEDVNQIQFTGHSAAYDFFGETISFLGEKESVNTVALDKEKLNSMRAKLPFLEDRDDFTLSK